GGLGARSRVSHGVPALAEPDRGLADRQRAPARLREKSSARGQALHVLAPPRRGLRKRRLRLPRAPVRRPRDARRNRRFRGVHPRRRVCELALPTGTQSVVTGRARHLPRHGALGFQLGRSRQPAPRRLCRTATETRAARAAIGRPAVGRTRRRQRQASFLEADVGAQGAASALLRSRLGVPIPRAARLPPGPGHRVWARRRSRGGRVPLVRKAPPRLRRYGAHAAAGHLAQRADRQRHLHGQRSRRNTARALSGGSPRTPGRGRTLMRCSVWAPKASRVELVYADSGERVPLAPRERGYFAGEASRLQHGVRYGFSLDGGPVLPDPRSRFQPEGVHGPSEWFDFGAFQWTDHGFRPEALTSAVVYELHVGTFSEEGTFDGVLQHLDHLVNLGVTHVELMPVAAFPGRRGWGYDGVDWYAPHAAYGGPAGLMRLV